MRALILGGGLAGSLMACRLLQRGNEVCLIDDRAPNSASRVAAGLYNVITGRFGAKTWLAETLLEEIKALLADPFYRGIEEEVHPMPIYRPFRDIEEYNLWSGRIQEPAYQHLVSFVERPIFPDLLHNPHGGIRIETCGWANIGGIVDLLHRLIEQHGGSCLVGDIPYERIDLNKKTIIWEDKTIRFDALICCEGHRIRNNPWFEKLPVQPNKGEILEIESPELSKLPFVVSRKIYVLPNAPDRWVVGATYANHFDVSGPSEAGKTEILGYLDKVIRAPYCVVAHRAGIRPTTPNRRPILGTHPDWPSVHVLTGFGAKGMLAAPYCSKLLAAKIIGEHPAIPEEISLSRFKAFRPRR